MRYIFRIDLDVFFIYSLHNTLSFENRECEEWSKSTLSFKKSPEGAFIYCFFLW